MNIQTLRRQEGQRLGFAATFDGSIAAYNGLSAAEQIALTQGMLTYILNNPGEFTPAQVATAQAESGRIATMTPQDSSITLGAIAVALGEEAQTVIGAPLQSVGQGVSSAVNMLGKILPLLMLVGVGIVVWPYIKKANY